MEPVDTTPPSHPLVAALGCVEGDLVGVAGVPVWTLDTGTTADVLIRLVRIESQVAAAKLAVLAHGDTVDVAGPSGAANTATWLAHTTRTSRSDAFRDTRLAAAFADGHDGVRAALAAGEIRVDQARVIVHAVDQLPTDTVDGLPPVPPEVITQAEAWLLAQAALHDATSLRILGRRLFEVVAPDLADAHEAARLAREEKKAAQAARLTMSDDGHGSVFVKAKVPALHGAMLKKALLAFAAPKHRAATASQEGEPSPERRPSPERMGHAFCELIESLTDDHLPAAGGTGATVVVTMDLATLVGGLKAARLDTGEAITADTARRLACQAGIIPAVLDGDSVPLDLGRTKRFHTRAQRIAIAVRDGGCTAQGCDWPPGMCQIHHDPAWAQGGVTDLAHARMLCPHHHARTHDPAYKTTKHPDGTITFHRRT